MAFDAIGVDAEEEGRHNLMSKCWTVHSQLVCWKINPSKFKLLDLFLNLMDDIPEIPPTWQLRCPEFINNVW